MTSEVTNDEAPKTQKSVWGPLLVTILVWGIFLLYSTIRSSFPGVNEPHYLCKSKHFWNPSWCSNDFFFQSSNPHYVFYLTIGALTQFFSLPTTAIVGRLISLGILAIGWTAFLRVLFRSQWPVLFVTVLFLSFQSITNFSGEWVVGGTESKVLAYGFLFWSLGLMIQKRWNLGAACAGLAISFHPVIGVWSLFGIIGSLLLIHKPWLNWNLLKVNCPRIFSASIILVLCSLPGLIPAISLVTEAKDPELARWAEYTQVFNRLKHHLDPYDFKAKAWWVYGIFLTLWLGLQIWLANRSNKEGSGIHQEFGSRFIRWYFVASLIFVIGGMINAFRMGPPEDMLMADLRVKLMKFYPFRLFDLLMPIVLGIALVKSSSSIFTKKKITYFLAPKIILFLGLLAFALWMPERQPSWFRAPESRREAWREACYWLKENTPEDVVVVPPRGNFAFQWYSHRAAYVRRKDCPQDAGGICEWERRMKVLADWGKASLNGKDKRYHTRDFVKLRELTDGDFFMVDRPKRKVDGKPVFANSIYRIYDLRNLSDSTEDSTEE